MNNKIWYNETISLLYVGYRRVCDAMLLSYIQKISDYEILYLSVNAFCAIVLAIFMIASNKSMKNISTQRGYVFTLATLFALLLSDSIIILFSHQIINYNKAIVIILEDLAYFSYVLLSCCWFYVFVVSNDKVLNKIKLRRYLLYLLVPLIIEILILFINKFVPLYYEICLKMVDGVKEYSYERGPLFFVQYIIIIFYLLATSIQCFIKSRNPEYFIERKKYQLYSFLGLLPLAYGLINIFIKNVPIATLGLTFSAIFVFLLSQNDQITEDYLTGLPNRRHIMSLIDKAMRNATKEKPAYLFMADLNKFKSINDDYGHLEGDEALVHTSEALFKAAEKAPNKANVGRYGGDEFLIVSTFESDEEAEAFITSIHQSIDDVNRKYVKQYNISMSVGYTKCIDKMNVKEAIEAADSKLYNIKKDRKENKKKRALNKK